MEEYGNHRESGIQEEPDLITGKAEGETFAQEGAGKARGEILAQEGAGKARGEILAQDGTEEVRGEALEQEGAEKEQESITRQEVNLWDALDKGKNRSTGRDSGVRRAKRVKKFLWGLLFLLGAAALVLGKMGYLSGGMSFWAIVFSVILLACLINGVAKRSFGGILFSLAFLIIVNDKMLHLEAITPWTVLGAAALGTIGLNLLFPKRKRWKYLKIGDRVISFGGETKRKGDEAKWQGDELSGENIHYEVSFGDAIKYVNGQDVSRVSLECSFGNLEVYFNNAALKDHQATVYAECSFGNMELYVPADWRVVVDIENSFGGTEENGHCNPDGENVLYVQGAVSFGNLEIYYIG